MDNRLGFALALACIAVGAWGWGWQGVVFALSVIAFWAVLQFNRSLRVMREAGRRPVGQVPSAVAFQATLAPGQTLLQLIARTGSLGQRVGPPADDPDAGDAPEVWRWADAGGDAVEVRFERGRVHSFTLERNG